MSDQDPIDARDLFQKRRERDPNAKGVTVEAPNATAARDRAYGPFITWEDIDKLTKAVDRQTKALEQHQHEMKSNTLAVDANTAAIDVARDTNAELVKVIAQLADLLSPRPA